MGERVAMIAATMPAGGLRCTDVSVAYRGRTAVAHISGTFQTGSLTAVVGPNGAGKTSLLRAIAGDLPLAGGQVERVGAGRIATLPQAAEIDRRFPLTVEEFVAAGLWRDLGVFGGVTRAGRERLGDALRAVGLAELETRGIGTLSTGQFQRARFARLMLQDAPVILLDEPFAAVDEDTAEVLLMLLQRWHGEGRTTIAALHDLAQVRRFFPCTLLLAREVVAWGPTRVALAPDAIARARKLSGQWDATDAHLSDTRLPDLRLSA